MKYKHQQGNKLSSFKPNLKRAAIFIPKDFNLSSYVRYVIEPNKSTKKYKKLRDWLNQAGFNSKEIADIRNSVQNGYTDRTTPLRGNSGKKDYVMLDFTLTPQQEKIGISSLDLKQTMGKSVLFQLFNLDKPVGYMEDLGKKMKKSSVEPLTGVTIDEGEVGGDVSLDGGGEGIEDPQLAEMGSEDGGGEDFRAGGRYKTKQTKLHKQGGSMDYMKAYRISRILNKFTTEKNKKILNKFAKGGKLKAASLQKNKLKSVSKKKEQEVFERSLAGGLLLR